MLREAMLRHYLLDSLCSLSDVKLSAAVSNKDKGNVERVFDEHRPNLEIDQSESRWR